MLSELSEEPIIVFLGFVVLSLGFCAVILLPAELMSWIGDLFGRKVNRTEASLPRDAEVRPPTENNVAVLKYPRPAVARQDEQDLRGDAA